MIDYSVLQAGIACENIDPACYEMVREDFFEEVSGIDFFEKAEGKSSKTNMSPEEIAEKKAKAKQLRKRILKVAAFIAVVGVAVRVATKVLPEREVKKLESEYGKLKTEIEDLQEEKRNVYLRHIDFSASLHEDSEGGLSKEDLAAWKKSSDNQRSEDKRLSGEIDKIDERIKVVVAKANHLIDTFHLKCNKINYFSERDYVKAHSPKSNMQLKHKIEIGKKDKK